MCPVLDLEYRNRRTLKNPDVRYWVENAGPNPFAKDLSELDFPEPDYVDLEASLRVIPALSSPSITFHQALSSKTWDEKHLDDRHKEVWKVRWNKEDGSSVDAVLKMVHKCPFSRFKFSLTLYLCF